jgi:hypothetical protein
VESLEQNGLLLGLMSRAPYQNAERSITGSLYADTLT